jgi:hypothetical protein
MSKGRGKRIKDKYWLMDARAISGYYQNDEELIDRAIVLSVANSYDEAVYDAKVFGFNCACFVVKKDDDSMSAVFMYQNGEIFDVRG